MGIFAVGWEQCRTKRRADLIYRKSLLEEKEMPKAQLRPSGGSPSADSREVTVGSRVGATGPPRLADGHSPAAGAQWDLTSRAGVTGPGSSGSAATDLQGYPMPPGYVRCQCIGWLTKRDIFLLLFFKTNMNTHVIEM